MTASTLTIGSKISTIPKNTNLNTAPPTPTIFNIVSLEQSVPLHTKKVSYQFNCLKKWNATMTSTCSTSRLYGVHSQTKNIREICVFTHTTGRTIDAHLISSNILIFSAQAGNKRRTLKLTKMDVS